MDFRAPGSGAPLSGVMAGLEAWDDRAFGPGGILHPQSIHEPRLQQQLHVSGFRLPPVTDDDAGDRDVVPVVRFPAWLQCPRCGTIRKHDAWKESAPGRPERLCGQCSADGENVFVVPVRFIVACEAGHLDEFPWKFWIGCECDRPALKLETRAPGLAGLVLRCEANGCKSKPRSMEGVFHKDALKDRKITCHGRRPWLPGDNETGCTAVPRVLQRGASNVYWGATLSALDIPPFSIDLADVFGKYWEQFSDRSEEEWPAIIDLLRLAEKTSLPRPVLLQLLADWKNALETGDDEPIEWAEYRQFHVARKQPVDKGEFQARPEPAPPELRHYLDAVVLAHRLREVRALVGFTRIHPPSGPFKNYRQKLSRLAVTPRDWLPAVELRGEGIFIGLAERRLREWEGREDVRARAAELAERVQEDLRPEEQMPDCSPRFLLIHTLAHAVMRQLSLECGYSSSALRERLYVGAPPYEMSGILIHTGSPDSEGTLGGLVRQGKQNLLSATVRAAIQSMSWCSSDPLCITCTTTLSSPRNMAACHACVLVPETSCQHFNALLDRAFLVGTPEQPPLGFFRELAGSMT
jgi:hypothetical protein